MTWLLSVLPLGLLSLGFPFFLVLLATATAVLLLFGTVPPAALHQTLYSSIDKFALLAVPFFIFAGDLMGRGGVSQRLVRWVMAMLGGMRGALPLTALGTTAGSTSVANGAQLKISGGITAAEVISAAGVGGNQGVVNNVSGSNTLSGAVTVTSSSSNEIQLNGGNQIGRAHV
mgnify:CR=1 FL=1